MEQLEQRAKRKSRGHNLRHIILTTVVMAGILSAAVVAPNVIGALGKMGIITPHKRRKELINRARDRLVKQGLMTRDNHGFLSLTKKGAHVLSGLEIANYQLKKPKHWDKKWRLLIFDIPEYRRALRNKLRRSLLAVGFQRLQHSVWVYPYPCEDFVALLKADFDIGKDLLYIITDEVERDRHLRIRFGLPEE